MSKEEKGQPTGFHEVAFEVVAVHFCTTENNGLVHLMLVDGRLGVLELEYLRRLGLCFWCV